MILEFSIEKAAEFKRILSSEDFEVVEWQRDGGSWTSTIQTRKPSLILLSEMLPKKDGLFCLEKMALLSPMTKIIFFHPFQGLYANQIEMKALDLGAAAVFSDSWTEARLRVSLQRVRKLILADRVQMQKLTVIKTN
jgi:chemotaxis response regulator CheB